MERLATSKLSLDFTWKCIDIVVIDKTKEINIMRIWMILVDTLMGWWERIRLIVKLNKKKSTYTWPHHYFLNKKNKTITTTVDALVKCFTHSVVYFIKISKIAIVVHLAKQFFSIVILHLDKYGEWSKSSDDKNKVTRSNARENE